MSRHKLFVENQHNFRSSSELNNCSFELTNSSRKDADDPVSPFAISPKRIGGRKQNYRITKKAKTNYVNTNQFHPANIHQTSVECTLNDKIEVGQSPDPKRSKEELNESLLDSDLMDINLFSKFNQKLPYTMEEDELILKHVLKGQNIFRVSSILLWKHLESKKDNPKRTYQSLKNRFLRNIKPVIFTTYGHLIRNKETTNMILTKFPELKKQMRIGETLSRIQIPVRNHSEKSPEVTTPSPTPKVTQKNLRKSPKQAPEAVESSLTVSSNSSSFQNVNFDRQVKFKNNSLTVLVNLNHRSIKKDTNPVSLLLNERFRKVKSNLGPSACPFCGSRFSKISETCGSETESESVIPSSVEKGRENQGRKKLRSQRSSGKKINLQASKSNLRSQSLLTYEDKDEDEDTGGRVGNSKINIQEKTKGDKDCSQKSIGGDSQRGDEVDSRQNDRMHVSKEFSSGTEKDYDSDIDLVYKNTMAGFRKLISADEEKLLLKKCLYKNRDSIGFNFDCEKNLDSYFLESSPDEKTPSLTIDYSTDS